MLALQFSLRTAALRAGQAVAAATVIVAPAMIAAQPASARFPVTEQQRQTAGEVAQAGVPLSALAPNAPDAYTVKRGDTLWGISTLYLTSPWRWVRSDGRARLEIAGGAPAGAGDVVRLSPGVRDLGGELEAIPSIPNRIIEPFLSRPAIVSPEELERYPRIVATQEQRVHTGVGDTVFGRGFADDGVERFAIFRPARPLFDPDDIDRRRPIAWEAFYLGVAQKTRGGEIATLRILESTQEIGVGDRLVPITRVPVMNYVPRRPEQPIDGRIVSIYSGLVETGTQSIVALNRGTSHGMQVGYVLDLLDTGATIRDRTSDRREYITLPDQRIGHLFVFRVFDGISYGLVLRVTQPVRVGDRFARPE